MADPRWWTVPDPSLVINDVIITSLLLLKVINVLANFCIPISSCCSFCSTLYYLSTFRFEGKQRWNLDSSNKTKLWRQNDLKLNHRVNQVMLRSWKWRVIIILCNFSGRIIRGFEVIEEDKRLLNRLSTDS